MDKPLIKFIKIIKSGSRAEVKEAQKQIEKFWYKIRFPRREKDKKTYEVFVYEIRNLGKIENLDNKAYLINTLKWPFLAIGEEHFEEWSEFILKYIQNPSGKIRQAIIHATDYLIMGTMMDLNFDFKNNNKISQSDKDRIGKNRDRFGDFVHRTELLLEKYDKPEFHRYKYIEKMPSSVYKSLQKLLVEVLLRSEYYENIYQDWLKETHYQNQDLVKEYIIRMKVINDYLAFHDQIDMHEIENNKNKFISERAKLFNKKYPLTAKKRLIFILAHIGSLECYQSLTKYLERPDDELVFWAEIALDECKTFLKSYILGKDSESVMVGAGKKGNKLRFYFILNHYQKKNFFESQKQIIIKFINRMAASTSFLIEKIEIIENFVLVTALHGLDQAPAELIESCIEACNKGERFLSEKYFVVNTHKPTENEIKDYLN
ncbi:MAG: hypothetical protein WCT08_01345 [Patescibacteria group bacterium]